MSEIMTFGLEEQEVSLAYYRGDETVEVYASDSTAITKLLKITDNYEILTTDNNGRITSAKFLLDINQISFRKKPKKMVLTPEQVEARRTSLAKARKIKNK